PPTSLSPLSHTQYSPAEIYTLSLHDALPISGVRHAGSICNVERRGVHAPARISAESAAAAWQHPARVPRAGQTLPAAQAPGQNRSEEHTSELQSPYDLVCRLLLEKKKQTSHL